MSRFFSAFRYFHRLALEDLFQKMNRNNSSCVTIPEILGNTSDSWQRSVFFLYGFLRLILKYASLGNFGPGLLLSVSDFSTSPVHPSDWLQTIFLTQLLYLTIYNSHRYNFQLKFWQHK